MEKERAGASAAGLTLPPKVVGKTSGHLVMKVDEVLWARKPPGEVSAVVLWWGSEEPTTFRPLDVSEDAVQRKNAGVIYEIRTSLDLFEKYLHMCGSLEIAMADKYGMPIGCASVMKLWQMINSCPYQGYYPIVNNFGNRIGDLHVSFNLRMLASGNDTIVTKLYSKQGVKTKDLKRLAPTKNKQSPVSSRSKEEKTKKNEKVIKDSLGSHEFVADASVLKCDSVNDGSDEYFFNIVSKESIQRRVSPTSNIISQILEHGTRLRDAMTASVMEDGIHIDLKNIPRLNISEVRSDKKLPLRAESGPSSVQGGRFNVSQDSHNPCEKKTNPVVEKKVLDYLSGKPMSQTEQEEALVALRSITPTKGVLDKVVPETHKEPEPKESLARNSSSNESLEIVTNVNEPRESHSPINDVTRTFEVDGHHLSQINCIRITVQSLVLNSVGIKRVGSCLKKKGSRSHSNMALHPPGVSFFVEYKFPFVAGSRPWESNVRYCSKRFNDHEVAFGDRTIHNLPETWRCSISDETNLGSFISALAFKICARHLHQRVPVSLGSATPDSARQLIESAHLRHDFDLPVIASDCLPVAQLRICIELGRDRIHFGGLFDPDNNSLGIGSPRTASSALKKIQLSSTNTTKKKDGRSVTTVTRNILSKPTSPTHKWKSVITPLKATQADRVIKRLVSNASDALKSSRSSSSSSAPSSARPKLKASSTNCQIRNQVSAFLPGGSIAFEEPHINAVVNERFLKHEFAVTLLQVIGTDYLTPSTADDTGFFVTYKFPVVNSMKSDSVEWCSCSTEPSEGTDGTWQRTQSKIHSLVLPQSKSFHTFLQHAFKTHRKACVSFALNVRCYGDQVQDSLIAETFLPLSSMLTLEDAYNKASRCNPNFSKTSCSSVVLELPLERCKGTTKNNCRLRLKLDYRHCFVEQPVEKENFPRSQGDSMTDNLPYYNYVKTKDATLKLMTDCEKKGGQPSDSPLTVLNWARTPSPGGIFHRGDVNLDFYHSVDINNQNAYPAARDLHASWEPVNENTNQLGRPHKMVHDSAYQLYSPEGTKSIVDVIHITKEMSQCDLQSSQKQSQSRCLEGLQDSSQRSTPEIVRPTTYNVRNTGKAATSDIQLVHQRNTSTRGTSPMLQEDSGSRHKSTSTDRLPDQKDSSQQAAIEKASQGCQTTPREIKQILRRDVGTSVNIIESLPEINDEISATSECKPGVVSQSSVDDVEIIDLASDEESVTTKPVPTEILNAENLTKASSDGPIFNEKESQLITEDASNFKVPTFTAKIGVECALHLQTRTAIVNQGDQTVKSFVFVSINSCGGDGSAHMVSNSVSISPAVINNGEPEWHWLTKVQLPIDLLVSTVKRLIFKIWLSEKALQDESSLDNGSASLIGFSALDLTVLSAGLPLISGWYNVMDFSGACQGQIKLSVEPLESVSKLVNLASLPCANVITQTDSPLSMFVAHCAFQEFPSHVTQFPDIRIQKLALHPGNEAKSTVLSRYQLVLQNSQRLSCDPLVNLQESVLRVHSPVPLQRTHESPALKIPPLEARQNCTMVSETVSTPTLPQENTDTGGSASALEVDKDPSILLREKLSELDTMTKTIKARLLTGVESAHKGLQANSQPVRKHIGEGDEHSETVPLSAGTCACHLKAKECRRGKEGVGTNRKLATGNETGIRMSEEPSASVTGNEQRKAVQKQRKTWERQEDLIDFGALSIEDGGEQSPQTEDLSDWLTESALQDVFNPFLFNNILNNMNSSRGVQVIELDDTETSDDNQDSHQTSCSPMSEEGKSMLSESCKRRSRRGDETYRKETPHFSHSQPLPQHHSRVGPAACDADSGVDVDLSANFHPNAFFGAAGVNQEPCFTHHRSTRSGWTVSSEKGESSSCSLSSPRNPQSTIPSSASATPSDSPQHSHTAAKGFQSESCRSRGTSGKRPVPPNADQCKRN